MTARIQPRIVVATLAILVVTVYIAGLRKSAASTADLARLHGRYNYQQILAHSRLPAFELFGDSAHWQMSAYTDLSYDERRGITHVWSVVCTDTAGKDLGYFGWNADSGDLENFSDRTRTSTLRPEGPVTVAEAASEGKRWLRELTYNRETSAWKLTTPPSHRWKAWVLRFAGQTGAADLRIDERSGKLLSYHLVPARA